MRLFKCPDNWGQGYCAPFVDGPACRPPKNSNKGGCFFIFMVGALLFALFVYLFFFVK